jgi:hypothetical protein
VLCTKSSHILQVASSSPCSLASNSSIEKQCIQYKWKQVVSSGSSIESYAPHLPQYKRSCNSAVSAVSRMLKKTARLGSGILSARPTKEEIVNGHLASSLFFSSLLPLLSRCLLVDHHLSICYRACAFAQGCCVLVRSMHLELPWRQYRSSDLGHVRKARLVEQLLPCAAHLAGPGLREHRHRPRLWFRCGSRTLFRFGHCRY